MASISIDVEATGLDFYHGTDVYLVTTCDREGQQLYWPDKVQVDPFTRQHKFSKQHLAEIKEYLLSFDDWYFANPVYDVTGLYHAGCDWIIDEWHRVRDAGLAAHLVHSEDKRKDLTTLVLKYLGVDIAPFETKVRKAVKEAHSLIRRNKNKDPNLDKWRIIRHKDKKVVFDPLMPSNKGSSSWKADMWIVEVLADYLDYPEDHPWRGLTLDYALTDTAVTLPLGRKLESIIREKNLSKIYRTRRNLLKINHEMQFKGITLNLERVDELSNQYLAESAKLGKQCTNLAKSIGCELELPKSGNNNSLREVVFGGKGFNLTPVSRSSKTNDPELNKKAIETYLSELSPRSKAYHFIKALGDKRSRDTAAGTYLAGYKKHSLPAPHSEHPKPRSFVRTQISRSEGNPSVEGDQEGLTDSDSVAQIEEVTLMETDSEGSNNDEPHSRILQDTGIQDLENDEEKVRRPKVKGLRRLGRKGNKSVQKVEGVSKLPRRHGTQANERTQTREEGQQQRIQSEELQVGNTKGTSKKYKKKQTTNKRRRNTLRSRVVGDTGNPGTDASFSNSIRMDGRGDTEEIDREGIKNQGNREVKGKKVYGRTQKENCISLERESERSQENKIKWGVLHPKLNPVGTATLRWSSSAPNEQNISKKKNFNLRYCFGPAEGREWWSIDANNIELRIPGYESGQPELIDLFEKSSEPPYYGSEHLLNFSTVYPDIWDKAVAKVGEDKAGPYCKEEYKSTYYSWCKNGGFAVGYGAIELEDVEGTADKAFHRMGSHKLLKSRFSMKEKLNQFYIDQANARGYVETLPDKHVDPHRGYPLYCTRNERGKIKPTVPLNYHVQGTAMWWMMMAMIRCSEYLDNLNKSKYGVNTLQLNADPKLSRMPNVGYFLIGQIHDELLFDFPVGKGPKPWKTNLPKIRKIKSMLELGGEGIGIPTPCSVEYHSDNWSKSEEIKV